jgi:GT2 family glycosyltransferase
LSSSPGYAIATGRLKERYPEKTVYNRLCDIEWATPVGDTSSCGGIFMSRAEAFASVGGFNTSMIAGEEPELCFRIRKAGWRIFSIDCPMALHDADIRRFAQWWKRKIRSGYAYAHASYLYKRSPGGGYHGRQTARIWLWAFALPVSIIALAIILGPYALALLAIYPLQVFRKSLTAPREIKDANIPLVYAFFSLFEKFPCFIGQLVFLRKRLSSEKAEIIEYK